MKTIVTRPAAKTDSTRGISPSADVPRASVLVVEDDPTLRRMLTYNLSREGFRVVASADGENAVQLAEAEGKTLNLVIVDLMLPGITGFQVLRRIRSFLDIPILILSARAEEQDKIDGLELGADDYVVKPFAMNELLARVRALLRRGANPQAKPPSVLYRGSIRIEPDRRRVVVNGTEVDLRAKEFGLLVALAMEPGRVFTRQQLVDSVWGEEIIVDHRTVDVHIAWLRKKLKHAGATEDAITTVYGTGYRFAPVWQETQPREHLAS